MSAVRIAIGLTLVCATAVSLALMGLSVTSAVIQVGMFLCALFAWMAVDEKGHHAGNLARRIKSGSGAVEIRQVGPGNAVDRVRAKEGIRVEQRVDEG